MCGLTIVALTRVYAYVMLKNVKSKFKVEKGAETKVIGFFHPACDAGAGGEKVLWQAVSAL